jgi:hypothetical protein
MDNFKEPIELDMTQAEKSALIQVMRQMESGEIVYQPGDCNTSFYADAIIADKAFNINAYGNEKDGKMLGCIGFWMGIDMGMTWEGARDYVGKQQQDTTKLHDLLWSNLDGNLKPDMVAKTIRSFLETGFVDWDIGYLTQDNH